VIASCVALAVAALPARADDARDPMRDPARSSAGQRDAELEASPRQDSDATLRGLLGGPRTSVDPELTELEALWSELAAEPLAKSAGKPGLDRAQSELTRLRQLIAAGADARDIARIKQLVWAALSLSDRQMARAELAAALHSALARRAQAEARLREARLAREQAELRLEEARGAGARAAGDESAR